MEQEARYRHELKYAISYGDYLSLRARLQPVMKPDPHAGPDGTYRISSIYFDNYRDVCLREKTDGLPYREKFRIRYYNEDLSFLTLEKKCKDRGLCKKYEAQVTEQQVRSLLRGNTAWMQESGQPLVQELYAAMRMRQLVPRVLVSYRREPYVYSAGNVRVTFDWDVRTGLFSRDFLNPDFLGIPAADEPNGRLLEIKYDDFLPGVLQTLLQLGSIRQEAFSKYGACRRFG